MSITQTSVWPHVGRSDIGASYIDNNITWPNLPVTGRIAIGNPVRDFVTAASVGAHYDARAALLQRETSAPPIWSSAFDDQVSGTPSADAMAGGDGNDSYAVNHVHDIVTERVGDGRGGIDTVLVLINDNLSNNVENLSLIGIDLVNGTGNRRANVITGNADNNILDGKAGADLMYGRAGNDTYVVDNAGDQVFEAANGGSDTLVATISYTLAASQQIETLQHLGATGTQALNLTGNEFANTLIGYGGANILDGKACADRLQGRAGNDIFVFSPPSAPTMSTA